MKPVIILLIIFFAVRYMRKHYLAKLRQAQEAARGEVYDEPREQAGEEMALDPVCNSYVSVSTALKTSTDEGTRYFCSDECRAKFLRS